MKNVSSKFRSLSKLFSPLVDQPSNILESSSKLYCIRPLYRSSHSLSSQNNLFSKTWKSQDVFTPNLYCQSTLVRFCSKLPPNSNTTCCPTQPNPEKPEEPKPSLYKRFKAMYRDYWYVLVPVHLVTSAAWFGSFYYMASSGVDIVSLLESLNVSDKLINPFRNGHSTTGYLAISYALYKIATPLRYTVTLGGTTVSINYLKKWGYIKPVPSTERLKEIYEDKKFQIREKGQTIRDNMIHSLKPSENN